MRFKNGKLILDNGYESFTTFWQDFSIADAFGISAVQDTYNRAFNEWKGDYKYLTELALVLNYKLWQYYRTNDELAKLYRDLWIKTDEYAGEHLNDEEYSYYYRVLD